MYDYDPHVTTEHGYAEVFNCFDGETRFLCSTDALALRLCKLLSGLEG